MSKATRWADTCVVFGAGERVLLPVVAELAGETRGVVCDEELLCERTGLSRGRLRYALESLEGSGLLTWEQTMSGRTSVKLAIVDLPDELRTISSDASG